MQKLRRRHRSVNTLVLLLVLATLALSGCGSLPQPRPAPPAAPTPVPVVESDPAVATLLKQSSIKSPDGAWAAATLLVPGKVGVWTMRSDGTQLRQVSRALPTMALQPLWTPRGELLFLDNQLVWQAATTEGVVHPFLPDHLGSSAQIQGFTQDGRLVYLTNWCYCLTPEADRRTKELWSVGLDGTGPQKLATLPPEHDPTKPADAPAFLQAEPLGLVGGFAVLRRHAPGTKTGTVDYVLEAIRLDGKQTKLLTRQPTGPDKRLDVSVQGANIAWSYVQQIPVVRSPGQNTPPPDPTAPPQFTTKVLASATVALSAQVFENATLGVRWTPPATFAIQEAPDNSSVAFRPEGVAPAAGSPAVVIQLCPGASLAACVPALPAGFQAPAPVQVTVAGVRATQFVISRTGPTGGWQERHTILPRPGGALDLVAIVSGAATPTVQDTAVLGAYQDLLSTVQLLATPTKP